MSNEITLIDPPGGWRWGFPKVIPLDQLARAQEWLVENGYPQSEIDSYGDRFYYRQWTVNLDESHNNLTYVDQELAARRARRQKLVLDIKGAIGFSLIMVAVCFAVAKFLTGDVPSVMVQCSVFLISCAVALVSLRKEWIS